MFDARLLFNDGLGELVGRIVALHQILDQALPWYVEFPGLSFETSDIDNSFPKKWKY